LKNKKDIEKIYDILAMRLTVEKTEDCYRALGIVHGSWRPLPGRIKDYIAFPKQNGYQSLHTTVFTGDGDLVEVQIRTAEMHKAAEYGVAAHAIYKAGEKSKKQITPWIEAMLPHSVNEIKKDFLSERIFVFTPKGDVVDLPIGWLSIFTHHSDLGDKCRVINGKFSISPSAVNHYKNSARVAMLEYVKTSFPKKYVKILINN
jgi:GTP pyrophosphokinase